MSSVRSRRHRATPTPTHGDDTLERRRWHRGALLAMATASGAAALIYQVVWMRRLVLVFGSTTLATSTVLVAFLGGLAIGAWLWGRVADRHVPWNVGVFGLVEAATGAYGLLSMLLLAGVQAVYVRLYPVFEGASGLGVGAQVFLSAAVIMPAAILMGGTVPLLGAAFQKAERVDLFFTYVTVAIAISLLVYIFALKNKKTTHLDREQGDAWNRPAKDDDKDKDLINA